MVEVQAQGVETRISPVPQGWVDVVGTQVFFTDEGFEAAERAALERSQGGEVTEAVGVRRGTYTSYEIELTGILGEIAAAAFYDVDVDLSVREKRRSSASDITVAGRTMNVKTTRHPRSVKPHLLVRDYDTGHDAYLVVSLDLDARICDLLGWAWREEVQAKRPQPYRDPEVLTRIVPFDELHPPRRRRPRERHKARVTDELQKRRSRKPDRGMIASWCREEFGWVTIRDPETGEMHDVATNDAKESYPWALWESSKRKELWKEGDKKAYRYTSAEMEELWQRERPPMPEEGIVEEHTDDLED